jgi:hypothetical protein
LTPGRIGESHLFAESEAGPVMEIKWGGARRFSPLPARRIARQVTQRRSFSERLKRGVARHWDRPRLPALNGTAGQGAIGVLLFCSVCRTASLIQFFHRDGAVNIHEQAAGVLASFRDHREDGRSAWALYDLRNPAGLLPPGEPPF